MTRGLILLLILALFYFLPTVIALMRQHKDAPAIAAINILLGWSVVGWFASFIWALADPSGRRGGTQTVVINTSQTNAPALPAAGPREVAPQPTLTAAPVSQATPALARPATEGSDRDTAFWDSLKDKSNPDDLEEYLVRFPAGKFAELARTRLQRKGVLPPPVAAATEAPEPMPATVAPPPTAAPPAAISCRNCGAGVAPGVRFCDECGAAIAA